MQQVFKNMFESVKDGGKIAIQYCNQMYPFVSNAYKELNLEKAERIFQMYQLESRANIDQYCSSTGFEIVSSHEKPREQASVFENIESLLKYHWSTTHGVFDPSLVTGERLQRFLDQCSRGDGNPRLGYRYIFCQLIAVKQATQTKYDVLTLRFTS